MRFLVVGNPENRRLTAFAAAVHAAGHEADLLSWSDLLRGRADLKERAEGAVVKLDSPGEDFEVERRLIALGAEVEDREHPDAEFVSAGHALDLPPDRGRIRYARQWYRGFQQLLRTCARDFVAAPPQLLFNRPATIALQFDKPRCHERVREAGVEVAPALTRVDSYEALRDELRTAGWSRVFVKLSWGSSASGVLALQVRPGRVQAETSVELTREGGEVRLYNSLRVRRYTEEAEVALIVDTLAREGLHVERWLPKASLEGRVFDLRVLVIGGRARQAVVRSSRSPLTNLHLDNERGDLSAVQARLGRAGWEAVEELAVRACAPLPGLYAGVDVLIRSTWKGAAVVEVNAFGDLLPRLRHEGETCYEAEINEVLRRVATRRPQ
ncbi:MAG: STM4014 family protein [Planctomycetes bacterium]|nr:STM4014 family protein [Planctomycetota bacterium]